MHANTGRLPQSPFQQLLYAIGVRVDKLVQAHIHICNPSATRHPCSRLCYHVPQPPLVRARLLPGGQSHNNQSSSIFQGAHHKDTRSLRTLTFMCSRSFGSYGSRIYICVDIHFGLKSARHQSQTSSRVWFRLQCCYVSEN